MSTKELGNLLRHLGINPTKEELQVLKTRSSNKSLTKSIWRQHGRLKTNALIHCIYLKSSIIEFPSCAPLYWPLMLALLAFLPWFIIINKNSFSGPDNSNWPPRDRISETSWFTWHDVKDYHGEKLRCSDWGCFQMLW